MESPWAYILLMIKKLFFVFRPFFKACGFADDRMGSTTMMFTKELGGLIWNEKKDVGSSETYLQVKASWMIFRQKSFMNLFLCDVSEKEKPKSQCLFCIWIWCLWQLFFTSILSCKKQRILVYYYSLSSGRNVLYQNWIQTILSKITVSIYF